MWTLNLEDLRESLNCGLLRIYGGLRPAHERIAVTDQPLLVEVVLGTFVQIAEGPLVTTDIEPSTCKATGIATWGRIFKDDWTTPIVDCEVGLAGSGCSVELSSTRLLIGGEVSFTQVAVGFPN